MAGSPNGLSDAAAAASKKEWGILLPAKEQRRSGLPGSEGEKDEEVKKANGLIIGTLHLLICLETYKCGRTEHEQPDHIGKGEKRAVAAGQQVPADEQDAKERGQKMEFKFWGNFQPGNRPKSGYKNGCKRKFQLAPRSNFALTKKR